MGLPPSAVASFTGQSRLRITVDPRTGVFLRRLAGLRASRVLITRRLFPVDLQTVTTEPVPGANAYFLDGLTDTDAVTLWRALGITGSRAELIELFATFDNYPLLIRALAGEVARFRGLLGWDRAGNRYDLHPVVRGVAWSSLDPDARHGIDLRLAKHLGEVPEVDQASIASVDDLSNMIELYHTLVRLGRLNDAVELLSGRIFGPLARLGGFRYLAELARIVIRPGKDPDWQQKIASEGDLDDAANVPFIMNASYQFAGDPVRALGSYDQLPPAQTAERLAVAKLVRQSMVLDQLGRLTKAEHHARSALAQPDLDDGLAGDAMTALGSVLLHRGLPEEGTAWLVGCVQSCHAVFDFVPPYELGWAAVCRGDVLSAQTFANELDSFAGATQLDMYLNGCVALLRGAVAGQLGDEDRAGETAQRRFGRRAAGRTQ